MRRDTDRASGGRTLPDEETFELPGSWRRVLHPRRGGIRRPPEAADDTAIARVRAEIRESRPRVEQVLTDPRSDPGLVKEAQEHLDGAETPVGAAIVAHLVAFHRSIDPAAFADAWAAAHGLVFAAETVAALLETRLEWEPGHTGGPWLAAEPEEGLDWAWRWQPAAVRVRALLAGAGDAEYRAVVEALAGHRAGRAQRLVVSYLVPTESRWVDECCATPPDSGTDDIVARTLLFCALGTGDQVTALGPYARLDWGQWSLDVIATVAEGVGTRVAPMLVGALDEDSGTDARKTVLGVLARVPTDEAFQIMLDRVEQKYVQPALMAAMRRYPARALRLLAAAVGGPAKTPAAVRRLLAGHLLAEPDVTAALLPSLPADQRVVVDEVAGELTRVEEVPAGSLPRLLVEPPWTRRRKSVKPVVVAGVRPPAETTVSWADGERDAWAAAGARYAHRHHDWDAIVRAHLSGPRPALPPQHMMVGLFVNGPEQLARPLLAGWRPRSPWDAENWMRPIAARFEADALPPALELTTAHPTAGSVLMPFLDVRVARLMADWLVRLKSVRRVALAWFARHGVAAARLLVSDAVGMPGRPRVAAEAALRLVASSHGAEAVARAAGEYGAEARAAVETLLAADPLDKIPARVPKAGAWADPALLPQVLLRDREHALPLASAAHVLTMLALSRPGEEYAGLAVVRELCDPASLAEFGWAVFERWRMAGMPSKDGWALTGLGAIGDDETVRRLTPVIRAWPGEGGHQRAVTGLDVLAEIGSEMALMHLDGIAQRVSYRGLKVRAQEKIEQVAEGLGLSREQLADRLVPDFGLDESGSLLLDYGPRRFVVGFDEQLKPYVLDESGRRRKDLPAPGARDDVELAPAARKRFSALKKDARAVAGEQIRRLESAMVTRRGWSRAEFGDLFVRHPLTSHLARRLVWTAETGETRTEFRVAEDRTFAGVDDDTVTLPDDARIHLPHPIELTETLGAWSEVFADYEILQPFPQLGRPIHTLTEEERASARLARFEAVAVPTTRLLGLQRRGWERGRPQDAGVERWFSREVEPGRHVVLDLDPGIAAGYLDDFPEQRLNAVWINTVPDDYRPSHAPTLRFGDLDPVTASEVLADLLDLTGRP